MGGLERRVKKLEAALGGEKCPRCSGAMAIYLNGALESVTKNGRRFTAEEAEAFVSEEEGGRCPVCRASRLTITLGAGRLARSAGA